MELKWFIHQLTACHSHWHPPLSISRGHCYTPPTQHTRTISLLLGRGFFRVARKSKRGKQASRNSTLIHRHHILVAATSRGRMTNQHAALGWLIFCFFPVLIRSSSKWVLATREHDERKQYTVLFGIYAAGPLFSTSKEKKMRQDLNLKLDFFKDRVECINRILRSCSSLPCFRRFYDPDVLARDVHKRSTHSSAAAAEEEAASGR